MATQELLREARIASSKAMLPKLRIALAKKAMQCLDADESDPKLARYRERAADLKAKIHEIETKGFVGDDVPVGVMIGAGGGGV